MSKNIHIKNMVCPRCITAVQDIFDSLKIDYDSIKLGEVAIKASLIEGQKLKLEKALLNNGFELLNDAKSTLISQIKALIIEQIHHNPDGLDVNFSTLLSAKLNHEYTSLSKLFSSIEGITIERYILKQKIEKVKELLFYNQLTLSEIAFQMHYSSTAHLSAQFKKETGMTATQFKKLRHPDLRSLDAL